MFENIKTSQRLADSMINALGKRNPTNKKAYVAINEFESRWWYPCVFDEVNQGLFGWSADDQLIYSGDNLAADIEAVLNAYIAKISS